MRQPLRLFLCVALWHAPTASLVFVRAPRIATQKPQRWAGAIAIDRLADRGDEVKRFNASGANAPPGKPSKNAVKY
jgi:hypothetical protein